MAIAVTGATGYLGARVIARLQALGIPTTACPGSASGLDLTDQRQVRDYFRPGRFETVIHCAASVPKTAADYSDDDAGLRSLKMTENLLTATLSRIVFTSSMTVYPADADMPVREEDAGAAATGYAGYKRRAELALEEANDTEVTIVRLPGLFGPPRESGLLYNAARELAAGRIPALDEPAPLWAALHVDDAADILVRSAAKTLSGEKILNAGYDSPMSVSQTVSELAALFGVDLPGGNAPVFQMNLTRLKQTVGLADQALADRLSELAAQARKSRETALA